MDTTMNETAGFALPLYPYGSTRYEAIYAVGDYAALTIEHALVKVRRWLVDGKVCASADTTPAELVAQALHLKRDQLIEIDDCNYCGATMPIRNLGIICTSWLQDGVIANGTRYYCATCKTEGKVN